MLAALKMAIKRFARWNRVLSRAASMPSSRGSCLGYVPDDWKIVRAMWAALEPFAETHHGPGKQMRR